MDGEIKRYLDIVYKDCKNDTQLFLTTIVNYLPAEFLESNGEHDALQMFAAAVKDRQSRLAAEAKTNTVQPPDVHDNESRDLFEDFEDEIVPETQEVQTQIDSEDSGESVRIPFYDKNNTCDSESQSKHTNDSDDESEYMQVQPESNVIEPVADEPQSQFLMANIDRNLICDLGMSALTQQMNTDHVSSDSDDSTLTETDLANGKTQKNGNSEKQCGDRSGSTTPDLDFLIDSGQGNSKEADPVQTNDENQPNSESIFEKCTQQFDEPRKDTSTEDIFALCTQPVTLFKHPAAASSTPIAKTKSKPVDESIYDAETQLTSDEQQQQREEDIYDIATQILPTSSNGKSNANQGDDHASKQNEQEEHDKSDDLFEKETQPVGTTKRVQPSEPSLENSEETDSDMFDEATQLMTEVSPAPTKRISLVTQCGPTSTPPWSMAARLPNDAIEQFVKEKQAEREATKQKLQKRSYIFSSAEEDDDDDNESDLEFDLEKPAQRMSRLSAIKENSSDGSVEETTREQNNSNHDAKKQSDYKRPPMKKQKSNDENDEVAAKRTTRSISVKVSREEVARHLRQNEEMVKPKKNTKATVEAKIDKSNTPKSAHQKKADPKEDTMNVRKSKRTKKSITNESSPPPPSSSVREKKQQKDEKSKADTSSITRNTRGAKRAKADDDDESANVKHSPIIGFINHHYSADTIETLSKRCHSDRNSTRKLYSNRLCILFTKINPTPYTKIIENLGGSIVDTPQLGSVLICDKISRTFKFLYCLAKGLPIVTPNWLSKSAEHGYFQPTDSYLVSDKNAEKRFNFKLKKSLETAQRSRLFTNYHIFATPNVQPTTDELCEIVECSGGKYGGSATMKRKPNTKFVLITHKKDKKLWPNYRSRYPDIQIVSSEGFMQSVVQQEINFSQYELAA